MLAPASQHSRANSVLRPLYARSAKSLAGLQFKAALNHLSISARLILLVVGLALPLNLIIVGVIWNLVNRANEVQRTSLLHAARSIAAGVDAEFGRYIALAEALSRSPALLDDNLGAFEAEARRAIPAGVDTWVLVSELDGQQLVNTIAKPGQVLPRRNPIAIAAMDRAFSTRSIVITDLFRGSLTQDLLANIEVPIFKDGQPFRSLAIVMRHREFLRLLSAASRSRPTSSGDSTRGSFLG